MGWLMSSYSGLVWKATLNCSATTLLDMLGYWAHFDGCGDHFGGCAVEGLVWAGVLKS